MIGIVVSRADSASESIGEQLLELADWREREGSDRPDGDGGGSYYTLETERASFELRTFGEWHLELDGVAEAFSDPDLVVFASRHSGETGPLLTAHFTGNFGPAEFGGRAGELAAAAPAAHKRLLEGFREHAPDGYEVGMECTHHGPTSVGAPSLFAELGSGEAEWEDAAGARAVGRSILDLEGVTHQERQVVAFGGGHYVPRPTRIVTETPWAVGHIGADWCLEEMGPIDPDVIDRAFERSGAEIAVIDGERPELESVIEELGYRVVSETWLREVDGRDLDLVARLESELDSVEAGLRFGEHGGPFEVRPLPVELIGTARAVDPDAVREAVERYTVAFGTTEGGSEVGERAAFASDADREALLEDLVGVLDREYEVERRSDGVLVRERAFDPEKAATLGVPEGPKFGRLASGEPVEVDGRTIDPDAVTSEEIRTLSYSP
ncbi:D-aminoacyl-tRNA deacylase [Halalkalicoccus subterraneus]|uniref:D-aminoacyl-tRNA deacylase n=1 Tax=Halalkalicoccus subterraneus TaxID=2675002 RepID=UPI000EFC8EFE|nr:D-aminoacyl-tRNA deacylase [Halalkalicoccus subterraneus]